MAENKKNNTPPSIFSGVQDAINSGKRRTPEMSPTQFANGENLIQGENAVENYQQSFLDWQVNKIAHNYYQRNLYFDTDRISAYQDFRAMDMSPEIAAALNIIRDECINGDTIIPLMNGKKLTIEELFKQNYKNFEVCSFNPIKQLYEPALCERVTYKGEQDVYKITFDDDSYVEATSEHLWLSKGKNEYKKTCELKEDDSIEPFYTRISNENDRIQGYEMILENGKWEYTHRIVKRMLCPDKKGVVHHKDINKLNNESTNLEVMDWFEHQKLHNSLNSDRWKNNKEYSEKMSRVFSETNSASGPYWSNKEWRRERVAKMSEVHRNRFKDLSTDELKEKFGYPGELNPMYNQGHKLFGNKNGRFLENIQREFYKEEIVDAFKNSYDIHDVCRLLNTKQRILNKSKSYKEIGYKELTKLLKKRNKNDFNHLNIVSIEQECKKYLGKIVLETQPSMTLIASELGWTFTEMKICLQNAGFKLWKDFAKKYNSKQLLLNYVKRQFILNNYKDLRSLCEDEKISINIVKNTLKGSKYKNLTGLLQTANHKIKSVEYSGKKRTYDLVNVGEHHNFVVLTSNGTGVISHNCLTRGEKGNILEIYSENSRIKDVLKDLFNKRLNVEFNLKLWIRDLVKYGDYFVHLHVDKDEGIYNFQTLYPEDVHREDGYDGKPDAVRFRIETMNEYLEEWQVAHFRLIEDTKKLPFGRSILDSARKLWKQLQLAEDSMLVYRLCLVGDTRIKTNNGYKYIKDIASGDIVYSYNKQGGLEESKVSHQINNGLRDVYEVKSQHVNIIGTETHPILVLRDGVVQYVDIKDLRAKKDKLINTIIDNEINVEIPRLFDGEYVSLSNEGRNECKKNRNNNSGKLIRNTINPTGAKNFLYVDGCTTDIGTALMICDEFKINSASLISCNKSEKNPQRINLPKFVDEEFARLFGFLIGDGSIRNNQIYFASGLDEKQNLYYASLLKKYFGSVSYYPDKRPGKKTGNYCVSSVVACNVFFKMGYIKGAANKRIPSWVFTASKNIRKSFIQGISDADGCERFTKSGLWFSTIELCNKKLVEDIKEVWSSIGLCSGGIGYRERIGGHEIEPGRVIPGTECWKVTITERTLPKYENVWSVKKLEKQEAVYDISVDNELHNFIANGTVVHNTRAPERRIFYIEVGSLEDGDVKQFVQKMQNQLKKQPVVDQRTGNINMKYNPGNITEDFFIPIRGDKASRIDTLPGACLALDTKIELLDGRSLELNEIITEFDSGKELWSYSINPNTGEMVPGRISWAGVTRKDAEVIKITLDNGETITCTPDHKFPTRFNGKKEAKDLTTGESLWAFNKKFEKIFKNKKRAKEYEMVYDHSKNDWIYTHRLVGNYAKVKGFSKEHVFDIKNKDLKKNTIHHYNFCHTNNSPENLLFMNFNDHVMLHQSMVKEYMQNRNEGIVEYWENISEEELIQKKNIAKINFKKGSDKLQELLLDRNYKKAFYEKTSKTLKVVRGTEKARIRQSEIAKEQWSKGTLRIAIIEKQTIKYSDNMLQFVVNRFRNGLSAEEIITDINSEESLFMTEFIELNSNNKQLKKMKAGFTHNNLVKMMKHFGYSNWRAFTKKAEFFNHKIVSIEFLTARQDTGTITIDGNEIHHDYHNFALTVGVFTQNSNLGDIQDIEYFQNKLFAALQVPKTYLNYAESMPGGSTLSQADLRFARTINGVQEIVLMELKRIANIHLYFSGFKDDIDNFSLSLTNPSTQQELLKLEIMKARLEVAKEFFSPEAFSFASYTYTMENILGMSKSDIKLILRQKKVEKKIFAEIDAAIDTYKKIGLFKDLDAKYEIPGAVAKPSEDGAGSDSGGSGAGSVLGGGMDGGMPGADMPGEDIGDNEAPGVSNDNINGSSDEGGATSPVGPPGEEEQPLPLSESKGIKLRKLLAESDKRFEGYLDDLLGTDESKSFVKSESSLLKNNAKLNFRTQQLFERIQNKLDMTSPVEIVDKVLQENSENVLFVNNKHLLAQTTDMLSALENLFKTKDNSLQEELIVVNEDETSLISNDFDEDDNSLNNPEQDSESMENDSGEKSIDTDEV